MKKFGLLMLFLAAAAWADVHVANAATISQRLTGRILLQVESHGEAWYVHPVDGKRFFLGRPADAFAVMRGLGLGITNANLAKIPMSTENGWVPTDLWSVVRGRILLQVESHGEAWYVNPVDGKRYFLGRPTDAFNLMRTLGLGITNADLTGVTIGTLPTSPAPSPVAPSRVNLFPDAGWVQVEINPEKNNIVLGVQQKLDETYHPYGVVYYSDDYGTSWQQSGSAYKIAIDQKNPQWVYGVNGSDLFRSNDWGKTFERVQPMLNGVPYTKGFYTIFSDRFVSQKIYLAGDGWGLYFSDDGGTTLSYKPFSDSISVPTSLQNTNLSRKFWSIEQDPQNPLVMYTSSEDGAHLNYTKSCDGSGCSYFAPNYDDYYIVRTIDGGQSWEAISSGLNWHSLAIQPYINVATRLTEWVAGEEGTGLYRLNESLDRWEKILSSGVITDFLDYGNGHRLFTNWSMLFETKDDGKTWSTLDIGAGTRTQWLSAADNGDLYIADFNNGIFKIPGYLK